MTGAKHTPTPDGKRCAIHEVVYPKFPSSSINGGFIKFGCIICVTAHRDELRRSHDAQVVALEQARKQIAALSKIDESGIGHDDAQSLVAHHVHEIQVLCDAFGYDPCEWLQEDVAKAAP